MANKTFFTYDEQIEKLEKEKQRLEKTIQQLTSRLELVEESLANL